MDMNSIEISNFKNFGHLKIENLGAVNLIVGRNNAGKSTLLEAISILASGARMSWLKELLEIRGMNTRFSINAEQPEVYEFENFRTLYHDRNHEAFKYDPIRIVSTDSASGQNAYVEIKLVDLIQVTETTEDGGKIRRRVVRDPDDTSMVIDSDIQPGLLISFNENKRIHSFGIISGRLNVYPDNSTPFEYVRTAEFTGDKNPSLFDKVALTPLEPVLIEAMHIVDSRIDAINFLKDDTRPRFAATGMRMDDNRVPYVVLKGSTEKYRLSTMGDGINRILTIILSMLNCSNGILLVDEFENGLHYSVQKELWELIDRLATELNIQVFATTHSNDCIKSFLRATRHSGQSRLIRLEKRAAGDIAVMYDDPDELDYITDNDIETR